ncbi:hypothetical protein PENSPDRAFT_672715, partial [Peniophora sp. CONT]
MDLLSRASLGNSVRNECHLRRGEEGDFKGPDLKRRRQLSPSPPCFLSDFEERTSASGWHYPRATARIVHPRRRVARPCKVRVSTRSPTARQVDGHSVTKSYDRVLAARRSQVRPRPSTYAQPVPETITCNGAASLELTRGAATNWLSKAAQNYDEQAVTAKSLRLGHFGTRKRHKKSQSATCIVTLKPNEPSLPQDRCRLTYSLLLIPSSSPGSFDAGSSFYAVPRTATVWEGKAPSWNHNLERFRFPATTGVCESGRCMTDLIRSTYVKAGSIPRGEVSAETSANVKAPTVHCCPCGTVISFAVSYDWHAAS